MFKVSFTKHVYKNGKLYDQLKGYRDFLPVVNKVIIGPEGKHDKLVLFGIIIKIN